MNTWEYIKDNYINKGLKIFPIESNGKKPMIENWMNDCSSDYMQVLYWYTHCPDCNWGLPCTPNNIFVLDLDKHDKEKNGVDNYNKLIKNLGGINTYCKTLECIQETPSGGQHMIFKTDDDLKNVANNSNIFKDYPGIDCRTDGYIVVEPSIINGKKYEFVTPNNCNPKSIPLELKRYILEHANLKSDIKKEPYKKPISVECGDRDNQLFMYITNLYYNTRLDSDEILCLAFNFNENILEKPFPERVIKYKVNKIFERDRGTCLFIKLNDD
jgi:hypothetical protein